MYNNTNITQSLTGVCGVSLC